MQRSKATLQKKHPHNETSKQKRKIETENVRLRQQRKMFFSQCRLTTTERK